MNGVTKCRTERTTELRKVRDGAMGTCILPSMRRPLRLGDTLVPKWKERAEKNENEDASHWPPVRKCPQHLELSEQCCSCLRGSSKSHPWSQEEPTELPCWGSWARPRSQEQHSAGPALCLVQEPKKLLLAELTSSATH